MPAVIAAFVYRLSLLCDHYNHCVPEGHLRRFTDFFEREIGSECVVLNARLQSEFERQLHSATSQLDKMKVGFEAEVNHFKDSVRSLGKQGLDYALESKLINNGTLLATHDGIVAVAKKVGLDLVTVRRSHLPDPSDKDDVVHLKKRGHYRPYHQDCHAPKNLISQIL